MIMLFTIVNHLNYDNFVFSLFIIIHAFNYDIFDGGSRKHISGPDAQGRGVRGEGKPSPRPEKQEFTKPVQDLIRPGPRPGEF